MASSDPSPITQVLAQLADGESGAADRLLPLVYDELRQIAGARMGREKAGHTLQATALVHEAWVRLGGREAVSWDSRAHFFGAAARAMRQIMVEQTRTKNREKRGGGSKPEPLHADIAAPVAAEGVDFEALDRALTRLESEHARPARLVMLRYFGGLPMAEIAELLGISLRSAERDWLFARTWLRRVLAAEA